MNTDTDDLNDSENVDSGPFDGLDCEYIVESKLLHFFDFRDTNSIDVLHVNARSLKKNYDKLETLLLNIAHTITAVAVTETWLSDNNYSAYNLPGYNFECLSRNNRTGGGVGIYLNSNMIYKARTDLCRMLNSIECLFIEVPQVNCKNILLGCIYRPPSSDNSLIDIFNLELLNLLQIIASEKDKTIILAGDFNLNLLNYATHKPQHSVCCKEGA
jgi:exonuclease III